MTAEFWQTWSDGKAEVATYALTGPGNGGGTCTMVTAIEPFSKSRRARAEGATGPDIARSVKLNVVRDLGGSREMISCWAWLEAFDNVADGMPAKIVFSGQNRSGQTWSQLIWSPARIAQTTHSSSQGGGDRQRSVPAQNDGISEDLLLLASRRIAWPRLRMGQTYTVSVLTSLLAEYRRGAPLVWTPVELTLGKDRETVIVPAGRYRTNPFRARWPDGATRVFDVEGDPPNRVVRWTTTGGERAELTEVQRVSDLPAR